MAENGPFGAPFSTPKIPPKEFMWVPFLRSCPGNFQHKLFSGGQKWGFRAGCKKFMLKKFRCFVRPLKIGQNTQDFVYFCQKYTKSCVFLSYFWPVLFWPILIFRGFWALRKARCIIAGFRSFLVSVLKRDWSIAHKRLNTSRYHKKRNFVSENSQRNPAAGADICRSLRALWAGNRKKS